MKKLFFTTILLALLSLFSNRQLFAQGEIDDEQQVVFQNERTYSFFLNNYGWGFNFRYGRHRTGYLLGLWEFDMGKINHPREYKFSTVGASQFSYVYGKLNEAIFMRAGYGRQKELFAKKDLKSVAIRRFYVAGASLCMLKPIYFDVLVDNIYGQGYIEQQQFSPSNEYNIVGRSGFFTGINETTFVPGAFVKAGISFEYSLKHDRVAALEVGGGIDAYTQKLEILDASDNPDILFTVFVAIRWGKVIERR